MTLRLKFLQNAKGRTEAVQMPIGDWNKVEDKLREAEFLTKLRTDLDNAFEEVSLHRQGKKRLKTLQQLLAER